MKNNLNQSYCEKKYSLLLMILFSLLVLLDLMMKAPLEGIISKYFYVFSPVLSEETESVSGGGGVSTFLSVVWRGSSSLKENSRGSFCWASCALSSLMSWSSVCTVWSGSVWVCLCSLAVWMNLTFEFDIILKRPWGSGFVFWMLCYGFSGISISGTPNSVTWLYWTSR